MPIYEYHCTSCGADLEIFQRMTDPTLQECPECAGALRKVFSPVGIVFKGSGFYATDSRKKSTVTSTSTPSTAASSTPAASASEPSPAASKSAPASPPAAAPAATSTASPAPSTTPAT